VEYVIRKCRKKPTVVVECLQWHQYENCNIEEMREFVGKDLVENWYGYRTIDNCKEELFEGISIKTLEGVHEVTDGDYIIKGVDGEFYPCKESIFIKTYDFVDEIKEEVDKYKIHKPSQFEIEQILKGR
jgi:hypothetical protein